MFSFGSIQSKNLRIFPTYLFLLSLFIASSGCSPKQIAGHKVCEGDIGKLIYKCPSGKSSADNSTTAGSGGGGIAGIFLKRVPSIHLAKYFLSKAPDVTSPSYKFQILCKWES